MTKKPTVKEFVEQLKDYEFDGDVVAADVNVLLEAVTYALGGKLEHWVCSTLHTRHKKIVITYDAEQK
jgi:hypothetical protein